MRLAVALVLVGCATEAPAPEPRRVASAPSNEPNAPPIAWSTWSRESFARARAERRIIVVDVSTEWCHWCHVMDQTTWSDPEVRALVAARFVAIRADADAEPAVGERYADWGWPAIALLTPDGDAITELRGHQPKERFLPLLRSLVATLDRGERLAPSAASSSSSSASSSGRIALEDARALAERQLDAMADAEQGGWGKVQKYPLTAPLEHSLFRMEHDPDDARTTARRDHAERTLAGEALLVDPVDGGMFQYSLEGVWTAPHYEKLAVVNGPALTAFSFAVRALGAPARVTAAATGIRWWLVSTMRSPDGAFYANQDADAPGLVGHAFYALDADARHATEAPRVDMHVYASHNGRVIAGLARFGAAKRDLVFVDDAALAFDVVEQTHGVAGAYEHEDDAGGPLYLADQVAMLDAALALHEATGRSRYRAAAYTIATRVRTDFAAPDGGFVAHTPDANGPALEARRPFRDNAEAARLLLRVGRLFDDDALKTAATHALERLCDPAVIEPEGRYVGELLVALDELLDEPVHVAVVGTPARVPALHRAALDLPLFWRVIEVRAPDARYSDLGGAAVYLCGESYCLPPATDVETLKKRAVTLTRKSR